MALNRKSVLSQKQKERVLKFIEPAVRTIWEACPTTEEAISIIDAAQATKNRKEILKKVNEDPHLLYLFHWPLFHNRLRGHY